MGHLQPQQCSCRPTTPVAALGQLYGASAIVASCPAQAAKLVQAVCLEEQATSALLLCLAFVLRVVCPSTAPTQPAGQGPRPFVPCPILLITCVLPGLGWVCPVSHCFFWPCCVPPQQCCRRCDECFCCAFAADGRQFPRPLVHTLVAQGSCSRQAVPLCETQLNPLLDCVGTSCEPLLCQAVTYVASPPANSAQWYSCYTTVNRCKQM